MAYKIKNDGYPVSLEQARKILNKDGEFYTDEQIKSIMALMDMWARINARTIINHLHKLKEQKSTNS